MSKIEADNYVEVSALRVQRSLLEFIEQEATPESGISASRFWEGLSDLVQQKRDRNVELLRHRARLQRAIDDWHRANPFPYDPADYRRFLEGIGYLLPEGESFAVTTVDVDPEIATVAGPQLVVPVTNARYALNAVNARWGSLYDAVYGSDVLGSAPRPGRYDSSRGAKVMAWTRAFLDDVVPLAHGSYSDSSSFRIMAGRLDIAMSDGSVTTLAKPHQFAGYNGPTDSPTSVLLVNHDLHIELVIDRMHEVGRADQAGIADVILEAATTVIVDCEDSVATVDGEDKAHAYRNWLGLVRGDLTTPVNKEGTTFTRRLADDRHFRTPTGGDLTINGRGLMLVRNVGHLMTTPAVVDGDGNEVHEGLLDAMVTVLCALHDGIGPSQIRNSRFGSIYIVKPKMHGPEEVAFADEVFNFVERTFDLPSNTVKLGVMDEERRTTLNLRECIRAAADRIMFINTGFLDRTGDEIHTSMQAGPVVRKIDMKQEIWMRAYEDWNVDVGIACGLPGRAQIGKGMWAAPDEMSAMLEQKIGHPLAGASCAWVPSPTAATLHATHYHRVDVAERQAKLAGQVRASLDELLTVPMARKASWTDGEIVEELENNAQGILGYVVRWIDQGVGCSKVPDITNTALMEDRATCRISSQHVANWLLHGIVSNDDVVHTMRRMARVVDDQNASDPLYRPMTTDLDGPAFQASLELVLRGTEQPSGYTEPILHTHRRQLKLQQRTGGAGR